MTGTSSSSTPTASGAKTTTAATAPALFSASATTPTPNALAAVTDLVPKPPTIPAFNPFMGIINAIATGLEKLLPAYDADPILAPSQVAAGWVVAINQILAGTYWNGAPTPFTVPVYILMVAAYQRYENLATNHLPGAPSVVATGPLPGTYKLTSNDPDGDPLTYWVDSQPSQGAIVMIPDGSFSYVPTLAGLRDGADVTFTVRINDSLGFLAHPLTPDGNDAYYTVSFHYAGSGLNNLPEFDSDGAPTVVAVNQVTGIVTGTSHATDPDGDTLTYSGIALYGNVVVNSDGSFTYTPTDLARHTAAGDLAASLGLNKDLVTITVNDGRGGIAFKSVAVDVVPSNAGPTVDKVTVGDPNALLGTVIGKITAHDDDGDIISYGPVLLTTSKGGVVAVSLLTGDFTYTPSLAARHAAAADDATDDDKSDTFTVTLTDGHGGSTQVEITVGVAPGLDLNSAPVFTSNPTVTNTNPSTGVVTGTFTVKDDDGDTLHYLVTNLLGPLTGSVTLNGGTFTYTPTASARHLAASIPLTDTVTITVTDGHGGITIKSVAVSILSDNSAPQVTNVQVGSPNSLGIVTGKVTAGDPDDGDIISYGPITFTTGKGGLVTVGALTGTFSYAPSLTARHLAASTTATADDKLDTFTITVSDGHGGTIDVPISVDILGANTDPAGLPSISLPDSNGVVRGSIIGTDLDGDSLTYSLVNGSNPTGATTGSSYSVGGGIVQLAADGTYTFIPKPSTAVIPGLDTDSFYVTITDGHGGTSTVKVTPLANLTIGTSTTSTAPNVESGKLNVSNGNTGLLTYSLGTNAAKGTVVVNADGTYTYTRNPALGHNITAADTFTVLGTDANGRTITVATVSVSPPLVNTAPSAGGAGTTISDSSLIDRGMIGGVAVTPATQTTTGTFTTTDPDGDPVTFAGGIYTTTKGGTVTVTSGGGFLYSWITYSDAHHKAAADNAPVSDKFDTVTINVSDGQGGTTAVTFSVPIIASNAGPSSNVSVGSADTLGVVRGSVSGSDSDGDSVTYSLVNAGNPGGATTNSTYTTNGGVVQLKPDGTFVYIPTTSAAGTDSFKVTVYDGHGGSSTATVSVPIVAPSTTTLGTGTNVQSGKLSIPTADVGLLTYGKGSDGAKGTVVVNADGSYTYTRNAALGHSTTPNDTFTITGTDANGKTVTFTVSVAPPVANAAPTGGSVTITSSSLSNYALIYNRQSTSGSIGASDADGDSVTFTAVSDLDTTNGGKVTVYANGTFSYTIDKLLASSYYHDAAKIGATGNTVADSFTVTIKDAFGGSTDYVVKVPIYAVNSAPSQPSSGVFWGLGANDWTSVSSSDGDNDSLTYTITKAPQHGSASYDKTLAILNTSNTQSGDTITLTVTDGYYVVNNGVVTSTPASASRTYTV
ncbi:tandem-95 repeat protein [Mycolicibacterium cosmeticum]|uniref:beta strand repeat-containing protein n=1 Tax=Mycolicibacterium cosmeticum TaxID=258533 RepID=UPI000A05C612|nr:Ig-like domain-containing protein [Mycolicibacterium cosmeticum]TLH70133.1 tandem-95 repeat protein [Mycolicibacterium cosmeticum]